MYVELQYLINNGSGHTFPFVSFSNKLSQILVFQSYYVLLVIFFLNSSTQAPKVMSFNVTLFSLSLNYSSVH